jgi:hypothetical protein
MIQTPIQRCDCCGLPVNTQSGENCPKCNYPIAVSKEINFLIATIGNLQRVITYGGANMTVAGLVHRYQARLNYLRQPNAAIAPVGVRVAGSGGEGLHGRPPVPPDGGRPGTEQATPVPVGARVAGSGGEGLHGRPLVPPDGSTPQRVFSWRSFFAEQTITILASIGAILLLVSH